MESASGIASEHSAQRALCLIDFYNSFDGDSVKAYPLVTTELSAAINLILEKDIKLSHIDVRLYGGWLDQGVLTSSASTIQAKLASPPFFPFVRSTGSTVIRGSVTLATSILRVPQIDWSSTKRERAGLPRIRLSNGTHPERCVGSIDCPISAFRKFTRNRTTECPFLGCNVTNSEAFQVIEQKMVDTMLVCDVLEACVSGSYGHVLMFSDDSDLLPALAMAQTFNMSRITLFRRSTQQPIHAQDLLTLGIELQHFPRRQL